MSTHSGERSGRGLLAVGISSSLLLSWPVGEWAAKTYGTAKAEQFVEAAGYKDPELLGIDHFAVELRGCGLDGEAEYKFDATAIDGQKVGVVVCRALLESSSIRQGAYVPPDTKPADLPHHQ